MNIQEHVSELQNEALKKRLWMTILFIAYPSYVIHSVVTAFYTIFYKNVALRDYALVFYALYNIIDLFVFFLSYAVIIYGIYRLSLSKIAPTFILAMGAPLFKYTLTLIVSPLVDGAMSKSEWIMGIFSILSSFALETLQLLLIIFISKRYIDKYKQMESVVAKASKTVGVEETQDLSVIPFKTLFGIKNPLQRGAFVSGLVVALLRLAKLAINDISKEIYAVDIGGYMLIIGGYLLEIVVGIMGYLFMLFLFITIDSADKCTKKG